MRYNRFSSSSNYAISKRLRSRLRKINDDDVDFIVLYSFFYKYASDILKDYFLSVIEDKELTLDEAYRTSKYQVSFREDALKMFGYYIEKPDAFIDEIINNKHDDNYFFFDYFDKFPSNVTFSKGSNYEKYFNLIFDLLKEKVNYNPEINAEKNLILKEIILYISRLDIGDEEFGFRDVFEEVSKSISKRSNLTPNYINDIFYALLSVEKSDFENIYVPFLGNASSILNMPPIFGLFKVYGKEKDQLTFFIALVGFFINYFDLDSVFLENSDVNDSVEMDSTSFDVILSNISRQNRILNNTTVEENIKITKRNKRMELEDVLNSNFNMDLNSLSKDLEFNDALESLVDKMEINAPSEFFGEYESLKDSEFLFLINLLNTLKKDGMMLISISRNFLLKNSLTTLRKYLTYEKNYIDTIISIPSGHVRSVYPQIILVFKRDKVSEDILFIDLSKNISNKKSPNRYSKALSDNLLLDDDDLTELVDVYLNKKSIDRFSSLVSIDEIEKNNFNLSISRYVDTYEGEFVQLEDLKQEKIDISKKMSLLDKKIKKMLDDLEINH